MKFYPKRISDQIATAAYRGEVVYYLLVISSLQTGQSPWANLCDKPASAYMTSRLTLEKGLGQDGTSEVCYSVYQMLLAYGII